MRAPLILLIAVLSVSVMGLSLIPGEQPGGGNAPMSLFESFYLVSYTATTIGFGEIPNALTTEQRVWVIAVIYMSVIGWAYAIGTMLTLIQDRGFRREVALQRFLGRVRRMPEPFLILVGYGQAGALVAQELDRRGRRLVVVDRLQERIDALDLASLRSDVPALSAETSHSVTLQLAGLELPRCVGVLAMTDDEESSLTAVQAAHLLRPGMNVVARARNRAVAEQMRAFGEPTVVDPFDAFGDRLRIVLRTPALAQLFDWLSSRPGQPPPARAEPPAHGQWVVVGHSPRTVEVAADLTADGLPVVVLDPDDTDQEGSNPLDQRFRDLMVESVGLVAAAERETQNVSFVHAARRANPDLFVVARQDAAEDRAIFTGLAPDLLLVPAAVVAREVLERLANPALWDFLTVAKDRGDSWAAHAFDSLVERVGLGSPDVWEVVVDSVEAPALVRRIHEAPLRLSDLLPSPFGGSDRLPIAALMLQRGGSRVLLPDEDTALEMGDVLLMAGGRGARRGWDLTLSRDEQLTYVLTGEQSASTWWGRRMA